MIRDLKIYGNISVFSLAFAALILIAALVGGKIVAISLRRSMREKVPEHHLDMLCKVAYYVIVAGGAMWALSALGVSLSGLMVAGGVAGLVLGFASQQIVGNLVSGLFLMVERPVKIGDQVNIEGTSGFVEDIRIISTSIRTYEGVLVRMPNEKVFTSNITNLVALGCRRIEYALAIRYEDDAEVAARAIKRVLQEHPFVLVEPEPEVFVDSLGDNGVNLTVRFWSPIATWYATRTELLWHVKKALQAEGMEIPFPQRVVRLVADEVPLGKKGRTVSRRK